MLKMASAINQVRKSTTNVLLLDAGDIFQGTVYFTRFKGELEIKLLNQMGYDAICIGNHEFDFGIDNFIQRSNEANFDFLCANYELKYTDKHPHFINSKIFHFNGFKIGVFGLGVDPRGTIRPDIAKDIKYLDSFQMAEHEVDVLKKQGANFIICLSHLGYSYTIDSEYGGLNMTNFIGNPTDIDLAEKVKGIDVIIGGHTHHFLSKPHIVENGESITYITQMGWAGLYLGKIDLDILSLSKCNFNFSILNPNSE